LAAEEARKSSTLIQKSVLRPDVTVGAIKELMKLTAQGKKMQVKFTACGLFAGDSSYLFTVTGVK
jgi:hypothetical protein